MINIEKIRKEIERRRLHFNKEAEKYQALNNGYSQNCYGARDALRDLENFIDSLSEEPDKSLEETAKTNAKINMTRTKLELNEIETLIHLVRARAVEPGHFQGLYKNILSRLNKMFDEEYAGREKKKEEP